MKVLTNNQYYSEIADVIREQNGTNNTYKPPQMVNALKDLFYEEVEGVPPLNFQGIGENLLDYRIDGASGGVGERTKNLLQNTATSQTINGVTFTVNDDGSVTCNGTPNSGIYSDLLLSGTLYGEKTIIEYGNYIFSSIGSSSALATIIGNGTREIGRAQGNDITFTDDVSWVLLRCYGVEEPQTVYPMIRLASIQDDTYEPYGYKVPVVVNGKNLCTNKNMVVGLYSAGAMVSSNLFITSDFIPVEYGKTYTASLFDLDENRVNNMVYEKINANKEWIGQNSTNKSITINNENIAYLRIRNFAANSQYITNNNYKYQLEEGSTETAYEPYIEETTNIYLDEPIEENESITLSDTNTNIPTIRGTNVLTVDTEVQPSKVYVKSRHESSYEKAMRENYEGIIADYEQQLASIES